MSATAIVIEHLTKTFPAIQGIGAFLWPRRSAGVEALRGVTLEVVQGEVFGLLGPNGGGKTTLLEILATYLLPTGGRAWVNGHDVVWDPLAVRRAVGYCPAGARGFDQRLSGRRNLEFFALLSRLSCSQARDRVAHLWKLVGLDRFSDGLVARYSDGMRQRLALARALLTDPPVLLLDEPTRGLDPRTAVEWRHVLREQLVGALGITILLVTHGLLEAEEICDRVAILEQGKVVVVGRVGEVLRSTQSHSLLVSFPRSTHRDEDWGMPRARE
ncbi:MAG: ABC transporter ATP-binding protein [Nitrospinae bacterium]|nr:ABC transporter ATP-binding protein [Nitrospinota bacterium]